MNHILLLRASFDEATERNFRRELPASLDTEVMHDGQFDAEDVSLEMYDGVVISGSAASVNDDKPWIAEAEDLVRRAVDREIPVLGVCWGHQLVATALGGVVEQKEQRELGYVQIEQRSNHPLFHGVTETFTAFESHTDYVTELPDGAERLAENEAAIQGFARGSAVGVQFHPEVDYRSAQHLADKYRHEDTAPSNPDVSVESWALAEEAQDVLRNFVYRCID